MARTAAIADPRAYWLNQAARYDREAARQLKAGSPVNYRHWTDKAAEARAHAETYTQPC